MSVVGPNIESQLQPNTGQITPGHVTMILRLLPNPDGFARTE